MLIIFVAEIKRAMNERLNITNSPQL